MTWYAIYTKPKCEESVALHLRNAGLEVISPKIRTKKYVRGKYLHVIEPLFRSYIFASFDNETHNHMIRYTRGVRYIVGRDNPVAVPVEIISTITDHMEGDLIIPVKEEIKKGERVCIHEGPFKDFYGIFERDMPGKERVVILLEALGSKMEIESISIRKA